MNTQMAQEQYGFYLKFKQPEMNDSVGKLHSFFNQLKHGNSVNIKIVKDKLK